MVATVHTRPESPRCDLVIPQRSDHLQEFCSRQKIRNRTIPFAYYWINITERRHPVLETLVYHKHLRWDRLEYTKEDKNNLPFHLHQMQNYILRSSSNIAYYNRGPGDELSHARLSNKRNIGIRSIIIGFAKKDVGIP